MQQILNRLKYISATLLFVLTTSVMSMPMVFAAANNNGNGPNAPGDNGTVKINDLDATDEDSSNANDPHVACTFAVNFFNYDAATIDATVSFKLQSPTKAGRTLSVTTGDLTPTFEGTGLAELDHSETYTLAFTGAPQPNQGYHVKMTVHAPFSQGSDTKYKTFWVEPCVPVLNPTEVTPAEPSATEPNCENPEMVVTPAVMAGIVWNHPTTTLQPGESVTFTASADTANNYTLKAGVTAEWTFTNSFNVENCEHKTVTPLAPTATKPTCETPNMTVTLPTAQAGVTWMPNGSTVLTPGQTVVYTASPSGDYTFTAGAKSHWDFKNTLDVQKCSTLIEAGHVRFHEACGLKHDYYVIPHKAHVTYYVNNSVIPTAPGKHIVTMPGDITVTAKADANYSLAGDAIWSYTFTDTDCPEKVKPPRVLFDDFCGLKDDMFTVPSRRGVEYRIDGQTVQAGTYPASGTVTVTAFAQDNFKLKGMKTSWTHTFKDQECGGNGGTETTPVTPANVDFRDLSCTTAGSYSVPVTEGVVYKDATGKTIIAGTYPVLTAANLTITAYPLDDTVSLAGTTQWQHAFASPANCGHVLGESTSTPVSPSGFVFVPGGKGAAPELANTGAETRPAAISALLIVLAAVAVYAVNPRKNSAR